MTFLNHLLFNLNSSTVVKEMETIINIIEFTPCFFKNDLAFKQISFIIQIHEVNSKV